MTQGRNQEEQRHRRNPAAPRQGQGDQEHGQEEPDVEDVLELRRCHHAVECREGRDAEAAQAQQRSPRPRERIVEEFRPIGGQV